MIQESLRLEVERFPPDPERGLRILEEETAALKAGRRVPAQLVFKLYDTYGFPVELTQDRVARGIDVDNEAFVLQMENNGKSPRAWKGSGEATTEAVWFDVKERSRRNGLPRL